MPCIENNDFDLKRKRKRDSFNNDEAKIAPGAFINTGFSSTPKKLVGRRRTLQPCNVKAQHFILNPCLEHKSIADLVHTEQMENTPAEPIALKPFEVVRKPPKKKKRETECAEACFENPALNLEMPEKQFNPYEVLREPTAKPQSGFVNEALNLRTNDAPAARNPFEIQRCGVSDASLAAANPAGVENLGLDSTAPTRLQLGIPFTPTVGYRIDFKNMSLAQLTPSKLLAEKLVFSPVVAPKRSLGAISEESTISIGKELDRYQLELENSINEAKLRKNGDVVAENKSHELTLQLALEQKITFTQKLAEIVEGEEEIQQESVIEMKDIVQFEEKSIVNKCNTSTEKKVEKDTKQQTECETDKKDNSCIDTNNADVVYASDTEEEDDIVEDFKTPAPFVRAYRRDGAQTLATSKESLNSVKSSKSTDSAEHKKLSNVKNLIRKSIRKLMHPNQQPNSNDKENNEKQQAVESEPDKHVNIMASIRHSLRRKPAKERLIEEQPEAEISIIDTSERTMKFKSNMPQTEYVKIEQLTNEKKHTLRNSIRRSTREMRQQIMKTVFHKKQEEYVFTK